MSKQLPVPPPAPASASRAERGASRAGRGAVKGANYLSRGSWKPRVTPPGRVRDAGGFLTGLLLYTAVVTYLRYGAAGWKGWLSAKFLNKPLTAAQAAADQSSGLLVQKSKGSSS